MGENARKEAKDRRCNSIVLNCKFVVGKGRLKTTRKVTMTMTMTMSSTGWLRLKDLVLFLIG